MSIKWIRLSVFALIFAFKVPINVFIIGIVVNLFNPQIEKQL